MLHIYKFKATLSYHANNSNRAIEKRLTIKPKTRCTEVEITAYYWFIPINRKSMSSNKANNVRAMKYTLLNKQQRAATYFIINR